MLKNQEERKAYISDAENWEPLIETELVRVEKLKGVNVAKVKVLVFGYDWLKDTLQENKHFSQLGNFELAKDGKTFKSICALSYSAVLEIVKNTKDN